jgi:AcrR family transcriptional regulator
MARPRSDDKRTAILAAAVQAIADQGLGAPTARIAKLAGVGEGTVFTYFATKDDLLNALYADLKLGLRDAMADGLPDGIGPRDGFRHTWARYIAWGVSQPARHKALKQLSVSDRITPATKAEVDSAFRVLAERLGHGCGKPHDPPSPFEQAIMGALAEVTMDFVAREPDRAQEHLDAGFAALLRAFNRF